MWWIKRKKGFFKWKKRKASPNSLGPSLILDKKYLFIIQYGGTTSTIDVLSQKNLLAKFHQITYLKNMILTYRKEFSLKNGPNLPDFENKFYQSPYFYYKFQYIAKNIEWFWFFSHFHIDTFGQIWLNHFEMISTLATSQNCKKKPWSKP